MNKTKNILTIAVFAAIILAIAIAQFIIPDKRISESERRVLEKKPELTVDAIFSGDYMTDLEDYLLDQFPLRDSFRTVKAVTKLYAFRQSDNNGLYTKDGMIFKIEYPLDEKQTSYAARRILSIYEDYLTAAGANVYYSIIPSKSYFADDSVLKLDYEKMLEIMQTTLSDVEYIDIFSHLSAADYYKTDTHWKQQNLFPVVSALAEAMGVAEYITPESDYEKNSLSPFYGVYYGQSALPSRADEIVYLTSDETESAVVTVFGVDDTSAVYDLEKFGSMDSYEIFLSGSQSLIAIDCPNAKTDRELVIFRDSFGSSLAPLFTGAYSKITLVDIRYMSPALAAENVDYTNADVLFLYSTTLLNSGAILK